MATKHPYYDFKKVLSYNCTYNFIVGGRGIGKTFGMKTKAMRDYFKTSEQFIYLRRYKEELSMARNTFMADIAHLFPMYVSRLNGFELQVAHRDSDLKKSDSWDTAGYFVSLSTAQKMKSVSFPRVTKIIYDEFILEKSLTHYLPNETVIFNNFYSTVDRWQDRVKVFFLANAVSIMNPYFITYKIDPQNSKDGFIKTADGFIVCHFPESALFGLSVMQTKFGRFIAETDESYANFAIGNTFADDNNVMVETKDPKSRYLYTLDTQNGVFSVWFNLFTREYVVQEKLPKQQNTFTLMPEHVSRDMPLLVFSDKLLGQLRAGFRQGRMTFDKPNTRNAFTQVFKR